MRVGRAAVVCIVSLDRLLLCRMTCVANLDTGLCLSAVLRQLRAGRFIEQVHLDASIPASGELFVRRGQWLKASRLAQSQSLVPDAELLQFRHDRQTTLVGQLPMIGKWAARGQRTT